MKTSNFKFNQENETYSLEEHVNKNVHCRIILQSR